MLNLVQSLALLNISVDEVKIINKVDNLMYEVNCYVTGLEQVNKVILNLEKSSFVEKVERIMR